MNFFSFDGCLHICKTCLCGIRKLEKVLIAKKLFKKVTILPRGQIKKTSCTICNIPIDTANVINILPRPTNSNGLVIIKLKRKLEYHGHVLCEPAGQFS